MIKMSLLLGTSVRITFTQVNNGIFTRIKPITPTRQIWPATLSQAKNFTEKISFLFE